MAKKKKEEEEDAWLWMSRPFSPGAVPVAAAISLPAELQNVVTHYKFTAYPRGGISPGENTLTRDSSER